MRPDPQVVQIPAGLDCREPRYRNAVMANQSDTPPDWFYRFMDDYVKAVDSEGKSDE